MGLFDKKEDKDISMDNTPLAPEDKEPGVMEVRSIFGVGYSCIVMGMVSEGSFSVGDDVTIYHADGSTTETAISRIEIGLNEMTDIAAKGRSASFSFEGIKKAEIQPGAIVKNKR